MSFQDVQAIYIKKNRRKFKGRPYGAIEHIVVDSTAYANLKHSSVRLLNIIVRQLTATNNGCLQATWSYCRGRGIGSENTLRIAIKDLLKNQLIYRTRSRGANGRPALYAVTWLPIKEKKGLFLDGFLKDGFLNIKKTTPKKLMVKPVKNCCLRSEKDEN
ncbi:MAG: hypothetical protein CBC42_04665 [Betaproteobacteria bacterium TMED82]|nr:MAG: hypothetical protein CBC42_04665 [Betaproteobacteria bacterium TMED82]